MGRNVVGLFLRSSGFQHNLIHSRRQLCKRTLVAVFPSEGHALRVRWISCLQQQGSIDLRRRWLQVRVDDVLPGGNVTVDAEHVENQADIAGPMAPADAVSVFCGIPGWRQRWVDEVFHAHSRRGPCCHEEVEVVHPIDRCHVDFQVPLFDAVDRKLDHRQDGFLAALTRRCQWSLSAVVH